MCERKLLNAQGKFYIGGRWNQNGRIMECVNTEKAIKLKRGVNFGDDLKYSVFEFN